MIDLILVLKMFLINWVLTSWSLEITNHLKPPENKLMSILLYLASCSKCLSFWITLLFTGGNFYVAASVAFLIMLVEKINYKTLL